MSSIKIYGYVYLYHCCVNRKHYVGQSTVSVGDRRYLHQWDSKQKKPKSALGAAIKKHGLESFQVSTIFIMLETESQSSDQLCLDQVEIELIQTFNSRTESDGGWGYNVRGGGNSKGKHSVETIEKIRRKNGARLAEYGKSYRGVPRTQETKDRIRQALLGKPSPLRGKPKSPEEAQRLRVLCLKNSLMMKGKPGHSKGKPSPLKGRPAHPNCLAAILRHAASRKGKPGFMLGKKRSLEAIMKTSMKLRGRKNPPRTQEAIRKNKETCLKKREAKLALVVL